MKSYIKTIVFAMLSFNVAIAGEKYFGVSTTNVETGYSSEKLSFGIGLRQFLYNVNKPSHFASNGDLEITAYYLQKSIRQAKIQFGGEYAFHYIQDRRPGRFDYGSSIALAKIGLESRINEYVGIYWDCVPIYISNFNLFELGTWDFNRIDIGILKPNLGIRAYF